MVILQKKGTVRYSIDLSRKTITKEDSIGEEVEKIDSTNFEPVKKLLSEKMVKNLGRIKELEYSERPMAIQKNRRLLKLKQENREIFPERCSN